MRSLLRTLPLITQRYYRGRFIQGPHEKMLRANADIPSPPDRHHEGILPDEAIAFVDGSAHLAQERRFRQARFAAVIMNQLGSDDGLFLSGKPSRAQTVPKAELSAGLQGVRSGNNVTVHCDCQHLLTLGPSSASCLMSSCQLATCGSFRTKRPTGHKAAKAAAPLCAEWTRLWAEHRRRCTQARRVHKCCVAVERCAMDKFLEVAPRKSTGVLAPVQQECCLTSWGVDACFVQAPFISFPGLPDAPFATL